MRSDQRCDEGRRCDSSLGGGVGGAGEVNGMFVYVGGARVGD